MTNKEKIFYLEMCLPNDVIQYRSENSDYVLYQFNKDDYHKYYLRVNEAFEYFVNGELPQRYSNKHYD